MKIFFKSLFYALLVIIFYILSLYQFPEFSTYVDEKTQNNFNETLKYKIEDIIADLKGEVWSIDDKIESVAPNTKGWIQERIGDNQAAQ